jgi:hypothetical protein
MKNLYAPPTANVEDPSVVSRAGWLRVISAVLGFSVVSLLLSWFLAPLLAEHLSKLAGFASERPGTAFFLLDLILSCSAFLVGCYMAARVVKGRPFIAAVGVGAVGWLVYFVEVGGPSGMLHSAYPLWYEFFPCHLSAAVLAAYLAKRRMG